MSDNIDFEYLTKEFESAMGLCSAIGAKGWAQAVAANKAVLEKTGVDCMELTGLTPGMNSAGITLKEIVHVDQFLYDRCFLNKKARVKTRDIYYAYIEFCQGSDLIPLNKTVFFKIFNEKFEIKRYAGLRLFHGVGLK